MAAQATLALALLGVLDAVVFASKTAQTIAYQANYQFADGTGANQIKQVYTAQLTLAASANQDLDLAGALSNALGQSITFTKIRAIVVRAAEANTNNVVVGGAPSNGFIGPFGAAAHTVAVPPGGLVALVAPNAAGWAVTASTGDLLRVANSGAGSTVTFDILLLGTA
jgi:hypothetical protein